MKSHGLTTLLLAGFICAMVAQPLRSAPPESQITALYQLDKLPALKPGVVCRNFSSYDRTGGNDDGFKGTYSQLRIVDSSSVVAEMEGPGAIRRIWFTHSKPYQFGLLGREKEHIKIYMNGEAEPRIDVPIEEFFSGNLTRFPRPLVGEALGGFYCYVPIPYEDGCRVVVEGTAVHFYQINYLDFPDDASVESFQMEMDESQHKQMEKAIHTWALPGDLEAFELTEAERQSYSLDLSAEETQSFTLQPGPRMIRAIYFSGSMEIPAESSIQITWDDRKTVAVDLPLQFLFGQADDPTSYRSLLFGNTGDGWYNYMPMPYGKRAKVTISTSQPLKGEFRIVSEALESMPETMGYFHGQYREQLPTVAGEYYTFLQIEGSGHYVGTYLVTHGPEGEHLPRWLEGDDIFEVDGEMVIHGTGTEDYFNCGWYAIHGRLHHSGATTSHGFPVYRYRDGVRRASAYRWHVSDPIPFQESIHAKIEHGPHNEFPAFYRSAAFYYLR